MSPSISGAKEQRTARRAMVGIAVAFLFAPMSLQAGTAPSSVPGATVDELLALVQRFNPDLAAAALESEAEVAKIGSAGALDDPMVNLTRDQGFRQTVLSVSQDFPLWGKRELRTHVAESNAQVVKGREGNVARELEERVKVAFAQYYQAHNALRVTHDIHLLLHAVSGTARARYAQGLASQSDAIRAELEQTRLDPELSVIERDEQMAKAKINALIAHPADASLAEPVVLRKVPAAAALPLDGLMARARDGNSELAAMRAEIATAEGERKLVDKSWYPDVTVTLGGSDLPNMSPRVVAGIGIKVPLQWGLRDAQAHAASAKKGAAQARLDGALLKIESELESGLATLRQTERTVDLLKNTLSQQSVAAYRSSLASYEVGRGDLTSVIEAAHQQLTIRIDLLKTQTEAQAALAAIERLVGGDL